MTGGLEPIYVAARWVLLDALFALEGHRRGAILVDAQALYLHVDSADLAVAPHTTDADIAIDPDTLLPEPRLADALRSAGFEPGPHPSRIGTRVTADGLLVDLLVPAAVGGTGRRGVDLGPHGNRVARKAIGRWKRRWWTTHAWSSRRWTRTIGAR